MALCESTRCNEGHKHHLAAYLPGQRAGNVGVALFEGRVIGRVRHMTDAPRDPKPWLWTITDTELASRPGWANTNGEMPRAGRPWPAWSNAVRSCGGASDESFGLRLAHFPALRGR